MTRIEAIARRSPETAYDLECEPVDSLIACIMKDRNEDIPYLLSRVKELEALVRPLVEKGYDDDHGLLCPFCFGNGPVIEKNKPSHKPDCPAMKALRELDETHER